MAEIVNLQGALTSAEQTRCLTGQDVERTRARNKARFEQIAPRIRERYGDIEDWEVRAIAKAEAGLAECRGCDGDCRKSVNRYFQPAVLVDERWGLSITNGLCPAGVQRMLRRECGLAEVPMRYAGKTFADYEVTGDNGRAVALAKKFCEVKPDAGLYLFGECGTGKTFLAAIIAQEFMKDFQRVIFGDVPALMHKIKASFDGGENPIDRYCDCDLLVLDDIGAGQITEWNVGQLYQILNARYSNGKPVIATSNYDLNALEGRLGSADMGTARRITSRISEMCTKTFLGTNDRRK